MGYFKIFTEFTEFTEFKENNSGFKLVGKGSSIERGKIIGRANAERNEFMIGLSALLLIPAKWGR